MQLRTLVLALCAGAIYFGWQALGLSTSEVATLYAPGVGADDYYTQLWVVEDRPYVWIRAERPTRTWLPAVRANPNVTLTRNGKRAAYVAEIQDDPESVAYVDALFHEKYGLADSVRAVLARRESTPIRLDPKLPR